MFFGVHKLKIISNQKLYYIIFEDNLNKCELQLSKEEYRNFLSFKSEKTKYKNDTLNIRNKLMKLCKSVCW